MPLNPQAPEVTTTSLTDDGTIPNNDRLPLLVYAAAVNVPTDDPAATFETLFRSNGWGGTWRNGVYPYHHYHAEAHEVLGIASGSVTVLFGGEAGVEVTATAGDVVVIPAGVGHKRIAMSGGLCVVGAYPAGQAPDLRREDPADRAYALDVIPHVALPSADPVHGAEGPLQRAWGVGHPR
ncbi:MAG: cupin domain-containing protein [Candidatus Poribacteria bacterium]